jgi:diguanylate cyclase (GGDEF)-like protein
VAAADQYGRSRTVVTADGQDCVVAPLSRPVVVMIPLAAAGGYALLPSGPVRDGAFAVLGLACVAAACAGLRHNPPSRRAGWLLIILGFLGWVVGDGLFSWQSAWDVAAYPGPADGAYLVAYVLMTAGLTVMVRQQSAHGGRQVAAVLDAAVVATGVAVVAGVFVLAPIAADSELSALGKMTSAFYPVADIVLLGILVRCWAVPSARTASFQLLMGALCLILIGDAYYTITTLLTGSVSSHLTNDLVWYAGYVLLAAAPWDLSVDAMAAASPHRQEEEADPTRRLYVLVLGLLLPPLSLVADGAYGGVEAWPVIAGGSALLSLLVMGRVAGLLSVVRAQSDQLTTLARSDALTGLPNRRTWDFELARACELARERGEPLTLAMLDLDHFKIYNDTHGHPAGDRLLQEASAVWSQHLLPGELLARVGGEEFGLLLPDCDGDAARDRLLDMLTSTPSGQTFSAGVATWHPDTEPSVALTAADEALYDAKRSGRNQVRLAPYVPSDLLLPQPRIALQPIVALSTGEVIGVEALSRFTGQEPMHVFEQARTLGRLAGLEAAAIGTARMVAPPGFLLSVNVDMSTLAAPEVGSALAGDLTGLILEVTEHTHSPSEADRITVVQDALRDYRDRGALVAVDDWGTGYSDMARLDFLEPDIVKLDISITQALDSARHQALVRSVLAWSARRGAQVCAEGIENEDQLEQLRALGVHLGQGFHLGRPELAAAHPFGWSPPKRSSTRSGHQPPASPPAPGRRLRASRQLSAQRPPDDSDDPPTATPSGAPVPGNHVQEQ